MTDPRRPRASAGRVAACRLLVTQAHARSARPALGAPKAVAIYAIVSRQPRQPGAIRIAVSDGRRGMRIPASAPRRPRSGMAVTVHKSRAIFFGGVFDEDVNDERMVSVFYNDLYGRPAAMGATPPRAARLGTYAVAMLAFVVVWSDARPSRSLQFQGESTRWYPLTLRAPKKAGAAGGGRRRRGQSKVRGRTQGGSEQISARGGRAGQGLQAVRGGAHLPVRAPWDTGQSCWRRPRTVHAVRRRRRCARR